VDVLTHFSDIFNISENRLQIAGNHHEIYLSDPHITTPEKLKTILRQAVKK
jgi:hypothetical protein